jgi:peptidoglycan hydrolase CwlO-like protein
MSNELSASDITQAFASVDAAYNAASVAQDQAVKLYGHVEWLTEQLAERDERIESLEQELADRSDDIDALDAQIEALEHPERA